MLDGCRARYGQKSAKDWNARSDRRLARQISRRSDMQTISCIFIWAHVESLADVTGQLKAKNETGHELGLKREGAVEAEDVNNPVKQHKAECEVMKHGASCGGA